MFYLVHQKLNRDIKAGIFNVLRNTVNRQSSVREAAREKRLRRETNHAQCAWNQAVLAEMWR